MLNVSLKPNDTRERGVVLDIPIWELQAVNLTHSRGTWNADMIGQEGKNVPVGGHWLIVGKCQDRISCAMATGVSSGGAMIWHPRIETALQRFFEKEHT